jgi:hypothetical protein
LPERIHVATARCTGGGASANIECKRTSSAELVPRRADPTRFTWIGVRRARV